MTKLYRDQAEKKFGETDEKFALTDRALGETGQRLDDTGRRIDETGKRIDVVEAKVASLATAVDDLAKLSAEQRTTLNALADDLKRTRGSVAEAARAMQPSVYLVTIKTPDGNLRPLATAWVVDRKRGLLATNAHVAELHKQVSSYAADLPNDSPLVVCSPGENGHTFEVIDVTIHPGYDAFTKLWETFDPSRPLGSQALEPIANAGPACDVALLHVEPNENLAPELKLASDETIRGLSAGDPVAMAGYPLEGILLGGVNVKQPFSELDVGIVKAVTDFFGSPAHDAELQLIHHSVASAGGASGSPIVNAAGEVVAVHNAANLFDCTVLDKNSKPTSQVRVGSPSNIHYGQRIDLVRELLGDADARASRQAQRAAEWKTRIAMFYTPGRLETARWALDDNARQFAKDLESSGEYTVQKTALDKPQYSSTADATARQMMHRAELPLPSAGYYVVAALGQSGQPVSLVAKFAGQESRGSAQRVGVDVAYDAQGGEARAVGNGGEHRARRYA